MTPVQNVEVMTEIERQWEAASPVVVSYMRAICHRELVLDAVLMAVRRRRQGVRHARLRAAPSAPHLTSHRSSGAPSMAGRPETPAIP